MLTTVIDRLISLGSKQFVIGAFVPVLVFAFLNAVLLYVEFDWFHDWASLQITALDAFAAGAVAVGLAVAAYVLWSLNAFLVEVLEGRHLRQRGWLRRTLTASQQRQFRALRADYDTARKSSSQIGRARAAWTEQLAQAALAGRGTNAGTTNGYDGVSGDAAAQLEQLRQRRVQAEDISVPDLQQAVTTFEKVLKTNDVRLPGPGTSGKVLADDHRELLTIIDYARDRWVAHEVALASHLQWRYGVREIEATAFGNVALALRSYGLTRYGLRVPTFWSRFQVVLQKNDKAFGTLQDAKAQLDFFVAACWLAIVSTAAWTVALPLWGSSAVRFVAVMIAGAMIARLCYLSAVENYLAFAEVVRASIDLHRLDVLEALHLPRPTSLRDERRIWESIQRVTGFGDETLDIGFHFPPEKKT